MVGNSSTLTVTGAATADLDDVTLTSSLLNISADSDGQLGNVFVNSSTLNSAIDFDRWMQIGSAPP